MLSLGRLLPERSGFPPIVMASRMIYPPMKIGILNGGLGKMTFVGEKGLQRRILRSLTVKELVTG